MWAFRGLAQFQGCEMSPGLFLNFKDGYKIFSEFIRVVTENGVALMTEGFQPGVPRSCTIGGQFEVLVL